MIFRKATIEDADAVSEIYDLARESLKRNGIPQWQEGVPGRSTFLQDVKDGNSYVIEDQGAVIAAITAAVRNASLIVFFTLSSLPAPNAVATRGCIAVPMPLKRQ